MVCEVFPPARARGEPNIFPYCQSDYWQIEVDPKDRDKTTFISHFDTFNFTMLPFGVTNAPAFFRRTMDCILSSLNWKKCLIYIDDAIVFGKTVTEHNDTLIEVFKCFENARLKLNLKKCHFMTMQFEYLGHLCECRRRVPYAF